MQYIYVNTLLLQQLEKIKSKQMELAKYMHDIRKKVEVQQEMNGKVAELVDLIPHLSQEILDLKKRASDAVVSEAVVPKPKNTGKAKKRPIENSSESPQKRQKTTEAHKATLNGLSKKYSKSKKH